MSEYHIMGTGSRSMITNPQARDHYELAERYVMSRLEENPDIVLISGMAEGWDEAIAKIGMRNNIPYVCAVPNKGYGQYYWGDHSKLKVNRMDRFNELLAHAKQVVYVCPRVYVNGVHANFIRNQWMVDLCDEALVYDAKSSGTKDAVARLRVAKKPWHVFPFVEQQKLL